MINLFDFICENFPFYKRLRLEKVNLFFRPININLIHEHKKIPNMDLDISNLNEYFAEICGFYATLSKNFKDEDLNGLRSNIITLKILNDKKFISKISSTGAYYVPKANTIVFRHGFDPHEMFHVASSYYSDNEYYSGFREYGVCGNGLNEGYTQLLTKRYFYLKYENAYLFEMFSAYYLEKIIGKQRMQSYYLNGNLNALIKDLLLYSNEKSISHFIARLDYYCGEVDNVLTIKDEKFLYNQMSKVVKFLISCYKNKLNLDDRLDNNIKVNLIGNYTNSISRDFSNLLKEQFKIKNSKEVYKYHIK